MSTSLLLLLIVQSSILLSQINDECINMEPICTDQGLQFTALNTVNIAPTGNNYSCLITQPDPTWYYLKISNTSQVLGELYMNLSASEDIDFIIYGPFDNLPQARATCGSLGSGTISFNGVKDCSYSNTNLEKPHLSGVQPDEIYVMLITNYAEIVQPVSLTLNDPVSTSFTDCSIITPKPTETPTQSPTRTTETPTQSPSITPSESPSAAPSLFPSTSPSASPSNSPSISPTSPPSAAPSLFPSTSPSVSPSNAPSDAPSLPPSGAPSWSPTNNPTDDPSLHPKRTNQPTVETSIAHSSLSTTSSTNISATDTTIDVNVAETCYDRNHHICQQITEWECDIHYYMTHCPYSCGYCFDNGTYCTDSSSFTFSPRSGSALGGNEIFVHSSCFNNTNQQIMYCTFGNNLIRGIPVNSTVFMCIAPAQRRDTSIVPFRVKFGNMYFKKQYFYTYEDYCSASAVIKGFGVQYANPFVFSVSGNTTRTIIWDANGFTTDLVTIYGRIWLHELEYYTEGIIDVTDNNGSYDVTIPDISSYTNREYKQQIQIKIWLDNTYTDTHSRRLLNSAVSSSTCTAVAFPSVTMKATNKYDGIDNYNDPQNMGMCIFSIKEVGIDTQLSRNFYVREFVSHDTADGFRLSAALIQCLQSIRDDIAIPITVTSGYRTMWQNDDVGGAGSSLHLSGTAADIKISGDVLKLAKSVICNCPRIFKGYGMNIGLGLGKTFVHVDMRKYYTYWARDVYEYSQFTKSEWGKYIGGITIDYRKCNPVLQFDLNNPFVQYESEKLRPETSAAAIQETKTQPDNMKLRHAKWQAFRQCHWSCNIASKLGSFNAKAATENYERNKFWQPCAVTKMHLTNYEYGRGVASQKKGCTQTCSQAMQSETLQTIPTTTTYCTLQSVIGYDHTDIIWYATPPMCIADESDALCNVPNDKDQPASAATTFGDPHYISFDGVEFDFQGIGVYELIVIEESNFVIQTLNQRILRDLGVSVVTGIAVKQGNYSVISVINDIRNSNTLEIWYGYKIMVLPPDNVPRTHEYFTLSYTGNKVTLNFDVGITVSLTNNYGLAVSISCFLSNRTKGLLGNFDGDINNDFTSKNGTAIPITSSNYEIYHSFGITWRVNTTSDILIPTEFYGSIHNLLDENDYNPVFDIDMSGLDATFIETARKVCNGNEACLFDVFATQDLSMANSTLNSISEFEKLKHLVNRSVTLCTPLCQNNGTCILDGVCECDERHFGERCEDTVEFTATTVPETTHLSHSTTFTVETVDVSEDFGREHMLDGIIPGLSGQIMLILIIVISCLLLCCCFIVCWIRHSSKGKTNKHDRVNTEIEMDGWNNDESLSLFTTQI